MPQLNALSNFTKRRRRRPRKPMAVDAPLFAPEVIAAERLRRQARVELDIHRRAAVGPGVLDEPPTVLEPAEVTALLTGLHDQLAAESDPQQPNP
ncbi:MAG: hypothetical protein AAGD32_10835 [Planctomycetota bacterium]